MKPYEYPSDEQLDRVKAWDCIGGVGPWFEYINTLWWAPDWGWHEYDGHEDSRHIHIYQISTGGWSGNESLIDAMRQNHLGWVSSFYQHRRGGHFEFRNERP